MRRDGALKVDLAVLNKGAKVCAAESLWCNADHEAVFVEGGDGQASAVDGDGVAQVTVD